MYRKVNRYLAVGLDLHIYYIQTLWKNPIIVLQGYLELS